MALTFDWGSSSPPPTLLLSVKGGKNTRLMDRSAPGVCATPLAPQVSKYRSLCLRNLLPVLRIWLPVQLREVIGGILSISRCDGLGWPAVVGSVGLLFLPDCWAASLVCLFKLAQQGPVGASYLFLSYFLLPFALSGQIQTLIPSTSHPRSSTYILLPDNRSIRISPLRGGQTAGSRGHELQSIAGQRSFPISADREPAVPTDLLPTAVSQPAKY